MRSARAAASAVGSGSFRADVRTEFRRVFHAPRDDVNSVVVNAALVTGLWFLLPPAMKDSLFVLTGPAAFTVVLETWMLADVPATNMVGKDVDTMVPALADPPRLRQLLRAKSVALALLVGPPCAAVSVVIGVVVGAWWRGALLACVLVTLPLGASSIAAWLGIIAPYRPLPLRWRWTHRKPWRPTIRWTSLVIIPYVFVPVVSCVLLAPAIICALAIGGRDPGDQLTANAALAGTVVACSVSLFAFAIGPRVSGYLARKRHARIGPLLADPTSGDSPTPRRRST